MRKTLENILRFLAKMILWRHKPEIVAVTGSVGKTNTKETIYHALKKYFKVRRNIKNYNNEIGVPLTILGQDICPRIGLTGILGWSAIFIKAISTILWQKNYPEILILEMGIRKPGDMKYLTSFIPVDVAVITTTGEFPSHLEFFSSKEKLIKEKALLIKSLDKEGTAILNYDDSSVQEIGQGLPSELKKIQYGFEEGSDLRISNFDFSIYDLSKGEFGINFKMEYQGSVVPVQSKRATGKHQALSIAAAAGVGLHFGLNLVEISGAFKEYYSLPGRSNLIKGIKKTWIIDDSYNASPLSTITALETLDQFSEKKRRKIAILGDMLELGQKTEEGHRQVGQKAAQIVDLLFVVGPRAAFIADQAKKKGLAQRKIFEFQTSKEAGLVIQKELKEDDIILVKGSRSMRMEKIVKEIMAHPEKASQLIV